MENSKIKSARQLGYNHAEAFFHMQYVGQNGNNSISLVIWNSRDGVTPFMTYSREYGIQLQHVQWGKDVFDKDYKPKKGDLIWASHNEQTAKELAEDCYQKQSEFLNEISVMSKDERIEKFGYDNKKHLEDILSNKETYISEMINRTLFEHGEPEPRLVLVDEDWK